LSDRRRSSDRVPACQSFIIFTYIGASALGRAALAELTRPGSLPHSHPSGHFNRDNREETSLIIRKLRTRKRTAKRRGSSVSTEQDQDFELDDEVEGDAVKPVTPEDYDCEEPHRHYHEQPHQDSFGSTSGLKTDWSTFSLPPRAQDHWQQSSYPSPLHAPFPSPLHTPSTATFGLPPQAYSINPSGSSSTPSYFQSSTAIPPALVEGESDARVTSSMHYNPTGLVAGLAPPSPANSSSSGSNSESNQQQPKGFVSPAPAPSRNLLGLFHHQTTTSTADNTSFAAPSSNAETFRRPPLYCTVESNHQYDTLYGHTALSE
jgi:hypothetical protein